MNICEVLNELDSLDIPEESGLNIFNIQISNKIFNIWKYFGNCIDTVDSDNMWDATQMSDMLYNSKLYTGPKKLADGDRKLPKEALATNVICGINEDEYIGFIYNIDNDIHYFFDISRGGN